MFDPAEDVMRERLKGEGPQAVRRHLDCPSDKILWAYLEETLPEEEEASRIADHVTDCAFCLEALLLAQEVRPGIQFGPKTLPRPEAVAEAIRVSGKKHFPWSPRPPKSLWLFLSLVCVGLSFLLSRYFLQFLILALLFGAKWIFDAATGRTLIVMYEALKKERHRKETPEETTDIPERRL